MVLIKIDSFFSKLKQQLNKKAGINHIAPELARKLKLIGKYFWPIKVITPTKTPITMVMI